MVKKDNSENWRPKWFKREEYPNPKTTTAEGWAWEFLRRHPEYQSDFDKYKYGILSGDFSGAYEIAMTYGFNKLSDPSIDDPNTEPDWIPQNWLSKGHGPLLNRIFFKALPFEHAGLVEVISPPSVIMRNLAEDKDKNLFEKTIVRSRRLESTKTVLAFDLSVPLKKQLADAEKILKKFLSSAKLDCSAPRILVQKL